MIHFKTAEYTRYKSISMIVREFPDIQAMQSNKMEKRSFVFTWGTDQSGVSATWSETSRIHLRRHALAESVTLSGLTENFRWIFAIYHRYLAFLKFEDSVVYPFKISGCEVAVL